MNLRTMMAEEFAEKEREREREKKEKEAEKERNVLVARGGTQIAKAKKKEQNCVRVE